MSIKHAIRSIKTSSELSIVERQVALNRFAQAADTLKGLRCVSNFRQIRQIDALLKDLS